MAIRALLANVMDAALPLPMVKLTLLLLVVAISSLVLKVTKPLAAVEPRGRLYTAGTQALVPLSHLPPLMLRLPAVFNCDVPSTLIAAELFCELTSLLT